jgi:hypothetical protein
LIHKLASIAKYSYNNYKQYYEELIKECEDSEYSKAVKYLKRARQEFYNTKENPVILD